MLAQRKTVERIDRECVWVHRHPKGKRRGEGEGGGIADNDILLGYQESLILEMSGPFVYFFDERLAQKIIQGAKRQQIK